MVFAAGLRFPGREPVTPERFQRVEDIFHAAADASAGERADVLDRLCAGDAELRAEVESLLAAMAGAPTHIQAAIGRAASRMAEEVAPAAPRRLGAYRLERELGRGGMGAVYLAVRDDDEYRTRVAIKLMHGGLETAEAVARFRDERQILATLEHPGIVRLLDGGSTDERLPYLVMEHVEGAPITQWAEERGLDVRVRVELFRGVCAAVAYAHQKLVVHRDIKPSNVLVTTEGQPKLLDFGIAKLLDPGAGREAATRTGMRLLTPEYASPEQMRGEPVSTAADVYALGALLYELLAGVQAQRMEGDGIEALQALLERDPQPPSVVAPAERRRAIAGDLDNIVLKALQKEPARRYASVEQLSEDLGRHLDGLPVLARAGTWTYRVGKLLRRRRGVIGAVGIVLALLSTATVVSVREARRADAAAREAAAAAHRADEQAKRAEKRFDDVRKLSSSLLFEVDGKIADLAGTTEARDLIVRRALEYVDGLAAEAKDDPALARELATAYVKIAGMQGGVDPPAGLESITKARRMLEGLVASARGDVPTRWLLVQALCFEANLHRLLDHRRAAREVGLAALALVAELPDDESFDYSLVATVHRGLYANALFDGEDVDVVAGSAQASLDVATRWAQKDPTDGPRCWIGMARTMRGFTLHLAGDPDQGAHELRESAAIIAAVVAKRPEIPNYRYVLMDAHLQSAMSSSGISDGVMWYPHAEDDLALAEEAARTALSLAERMEERDPRSFDSAWGLKRALMTHATIVAKRDPRRALPSSERARAVVAGMPASRHGSQSFKWDESMSQCILAVPLGALGRRAEALAATTAGLILADRDAAAPAAGALARMSPWMCRSLGARARRALGDGEAAADLLEQTAAGLRPMVAARPKMMVAYVGLVETLGELAALRPVQRCALLDEAATAWRSWPGTPTPYTRRRQAELDAARAGCR
jgi:hypothetical protein